MTGPDRPDDDLFDPAWVLLGVGLFAGLCLLAVGVYHWWQVAHLRPLE